jgi:hypothetical protein
VVAHDLERALTRRRAEGVGGVCEGIEMEHAREHCSRCETENRSEWRRERAGERLRDAAGNGSDTCSDEREERTAASDVGGVELDEAAERDARQKGDRGCEPAELSGRHR